jgi:hypothetical protein
MHVVASASSVGTKQSAREEYLSAARGGSARRKDWQAIVRSWSAPTLPDGLLIVERTSVANAQASVARVVVWDAKYRKLPRVQWESGLLYQAHAFRDCLAVRAFWRTGERAKWQSAKRVRWSIVLHPGPALDAPVYRCDRVDRFKTAAPTRHGLDALTPRNAGVAIVSAAPQSTRDVEQVVRQLLGAESRS